jgi:hypothetical protein
MKKSYKKIIGVAFGALFSLFALSPTNAQQRGSGVTDNSSNGGNSAPPQRTAPSAPAPQSTNSAPRTNNANVAPPQRNDNNSGQFQRGSATPQSNGNSNFQHFQHNTTNNGGNQQNNNNSGFQHFQHNNTNNANTPQQRSNNVGITPQQRGGNVNSGQQRGNNVNVGPQQRQFQRGSFNNQNRVGAVISPNARSYRTFPGLQFGKNHISVRPQGLYYNYRGYYSRYYTPRLGFRLNVLPFGYYPFSFGAYNYFYSDGLYYQYDNSEYTVVEPPVGAALTTLPDKAQSIVINGIQYYELNGVYYQPITKDDGTTVYQIAGKDGELNTSDPNAQQDDMPQVGDMVNTLPQDCRTIKLNGQKYYVSSDGYYFQDAVDDKGNKIYKIVGTPTDEPGSQQ